VRKYLLWTVGFGLEVLHVLIVVFLVLGKLWLNPWLVNILIVLTALAQLPKARCPLTLASHYFFEKAEPGKVLRDTITFKLYNRLRVWAALVTFLSFYISSELVVWVLLTPAK
jgi:hypothetical protein